uniref:Mediator of RNA polymerase II transcription subunit 22 n=1 Tax=Haemonchus contortus TaxID=6289 RepID=A0A7I4YB02_HAECO
MSQTPQQLDSRSSTEKLKHFQSELDVQLKLCKRIVEEGTKTSRIGAEQIRHVDDFIKTFRMLRTVTLEEICRTVPEIEDYDRSTLSQMLQTRKDINDKLDQLVHHVDELIEHLKKKYTQLSSCKNSRVALRLSRRRCGSESAFRYPAYDCKKLPGPSGCSYWNCRTNSNVVDDGETAFMILEDAK